MKKYLLKEIIKDRGFSAETLAIELNMNKATLSRKINGKSPLTLHEWTALKDLLNIDSTLERVLLS